MIKHIVSYKLAEGRSMEDVLKLKADVESLRNIIDDIVSIEVKIELLSSSTASAILISKFRDEAALERYQKHPEHMKVAQFVKGVFESRLCVDYIEE